MNRSAFRIATSLINSGSAMIIREASGPVILRTPFFATFLKRGDNPEGSVPPPTISLLVRFD